MADLNIIEATDPRRALIRRQLAAGAESASQAAPQAAPAQAASAPVQFTRQYSPEERQAQMQKLAAILKARPPQ